MAIMMMHAHAPYASLRPLALDQGGWVGGDGAFVEYDLPVAGPDAPNGLDGANACSSGVAAGAEPVVLGRARRPRGGGRLAAAGRGLLPQLLAS